MLRRREGEIEQGEEETVAAVAGLEAQVRRRGGAPCDHAHVHTRGLSVCSHAAHLACLMHAEYLCVCMHLCMHVRVCACMYVCVCMHVCTQASKLLAQIPITSLVSKCMYHD